MPSRKATAGLLAVAGLLLVANAVWLFPNAGEAEYTYERAEITVEDGTLTYEGVDYRWFRESNDLQPVGCQRYDSDGERACAFDEYLAENPPVTVSRQVSGGRITPDFVRIDGDYYRRIHRPDDSNVTHDVERVSPETVLEESANNVTGATVSDRGHTSLQYYVAVSGETVTTTEHPTLHDLGGVYRQNGTYYTVVATDRTINQPPLEFQQYQALRYALGFVGLVLLLAATHLEFTRRRE